MMFTLQANTVYNGLLWTGAVLVFICAPRNLAVCQNPKDITGATGLFSDEVTTITAHSAVVRALAFSPSRQTVAVAVNENVRIWDITGDKPKEVQVLHGPKHAPLVLKVCYSPDNKWLAFTSALEHQIRLWHVGSFPAKEQILPVHHAHPSEDMVFSADSRYLATAGTRELTARVWDLTAKQPKEKVVLDGHQNVVHSVAIAPDNKTVASISCGEEIFIWDIGADKPKKVTSLKMTEDRGGEFVGFTPDGKTLVEGASKTIEQKFVNSLLIGFWDLTTAKVVRTLEIKGGEDRFGNAAFAPDMKFVAIGYESGKLVLWDLQQNKATRQFSLSSPISAIAFSQDCQLVGAAHKNGKISIIELGVRKK